VNQAAGTAPRKVFGSPVSILTPPIEKPSNHPLKIGALIRESSWSPQLPCFGMRKHTYIYIFIFIIYIYIYTNIFTAYTALTFLTPPIETPDPPFMTPSKQIGVDIP